MIWVGNGQGARLGLPTLRLVSQNPNFLAVPADSADPVGWVGLTYRIGGEPCVAPKDDTGCTQGGTLANGGDEIHLCGKGLVTGEDRQDGQVPACSVLLNPQPGPAPLPLRPRLCFTFSLNV